MKCAFCHDEAKSGEHIWDNWINEVLPKNTRFNASRRVGNSDPIEFVSVGLNEKVPVVCPTRCNSGWMSSLSAKVKERFSGAMLNAEPFSLGPRDAILLAAFTFMKTAVMDYGYGNDDLFFTTLARKRLRLSLSIPPMTRMWLAAFQGTPRHSFINNFYRVDANAPGPLQGMQFFCYTYILGNLALQLLAPRWKDVRDWNRPLVTIAPAERWQPIATQFWPYPGSEIHWPPKAYLGDSAVKLFINRFDAPVRVS